MCSYIFTYVNRCLYFFYNDMIAMILRKKSCATISRFLEFIQYNLR